MTQAFNLSQFANKVNTSGQADLTTAVTGTLPVANGGSGATTLTSGAVLIGAGTSAITSVAAGTAGNILTSNGTTWTSASASGGGQIQTELFTSPGTWTKPASCIQVRVTVIGGGGGGGGGLSYIGSGGSGGTSSFGTLVSATGGGGGGPGPAGTAFGSNGSGTVSTGTSLKTGYVGRINYPAPASQSNTFISINSIAGYVGYPSSNSSTPYSSSSNSMAGVGGTYPGGSAGFGGAAGYAIASCPVSAPISITVGSGGTGISPATGVSTGGFGGAVLVEFVG